jgi:hypothetical protein
LQPCAESKDWHAPNVLQAKAPNLHPPRWRTLRQRARGCRGWWRHARGARLVAARCVRRRSRGSSAAASAQRQFRPCAWRAAVRGLALPPGAPSKLARIQACASAGSWQQASPLLACSGSWQQASPLLACSWRRYRECLSSWRPPSAPYAACACPRSCSVSSRLARGFTV